MKYYHQEEITLNNCNYTLRKYNEGIDMKKSKTVTLFSYNLCFSI